VLIVLDRDGRRSVPCLGSACLTRLRRSPMTNNILGPLGSHVDTNHQPHLNWWVIGGIFAVVVAGYILVKWRR
jgi:hypothetical protein